MDLLIKRSDFVRDISLDDREELCLKGTSEELEALASALLAKAKHPDMFFQTYTGIPGVLLHIEHYTDEAAPPRYEHDCTTCTYLGRFKEFDLYFCPQGGFATVIARDGDNGPDYASGMNVGSPELNEAERRSRKLGLLPEIVFEVFETTVAGVKFKRTGVREISAKGTDWITFGAECSDRMSFEHSCAMYYQYRW